MSHETSIPAFARRHIGPRQEDLQEMVSFLGYASNEEMLDALMPDEIRVAEPIRIEAAESEQAVLAELRERAAKNRVMTSLIGMGYYGTVTPAVIQRNVLENPSWYTAYTPYQAEISQGRLEALLNFQTMVGDLTGLDVSNSSLLDEGTAAAEAMTLMHRAAKAKDGDVMLVDDGLFPQTLGVIRTRATAIGLTVVVTDLTQVTDADSLGKLADGKKVFGAIVQYPDADGEIHDWAPLTEAVHAQGGLVTACADLLALTMLKEPGAWGADIAVGSTQRFGVPMMYGGPHAGYMSVRKGWERTMPGRLIGQSVDVEGKPGLRLALQTREQHIRREKATSNICTAQVLLAVMASMYAVYHGPAGLRRIAERVHGHTRRLADSLAQAGLTVETEHYFDTITVKAEKQADIVLGKAVVDGINLWKVDEDRIRLSLDQVTNEDVLRKVCAAFGAELLPETEVPSDLTAFARETEYLTHPTFNTYHSETAMMRYLKSLADKDFALDRGMIPLGSCTMKLNAVTEMMAITWPGFASLHPFVPVDQAVGYQQLIEELQGWLVEITGYDAVSVQPNSGASGEMAGLLAIRGYHEARGEGHRNICLIPSSAHGTNPASAVLAGMKVVVIKSTSEGEVDLDDLKQKVSEHRDNLAAIMVTYPSTHGVFEKTIQPLCELVHDAGGQVYVDGANMNAQVALARPGKYGADVSHLNLHKTFAIPHGGGGPGVGPIGVREHLAPYLPNHPLVPHAGPVTGPGNVASAPFGSAGVLPISWAYIRLMGEPGLKMATTAAVVNANYIARRLKDSYPILYTGHGDLVAHECILDLRKLTHDTGVTVDDVAKRLIDYGFHAPTMSFPVAGTLMVEPTESEDKIELDRFCDAMIQIRKEIDELVESGKPVEESVLRGAPHTAECATADEWPYSYSRKQAVYPEGVDPLKKYWPPVRRIDGPHGDRNLICTCPMPEAYEG